MVGKFSVFILSFFLLATQSQPKVIVFYGDSLTAGYGLSPTEAFPALIESKIKNAGKNYRVVNAGLSGETSAGGLSRLDWVIRQPVDVFVLELGANDGLRGLPTAETRKNLQAIIDKVKAKNPQVKLVLAGMMVPPNMGADYANDFKKIYPELATVNHAKLVPFLLKDVAGIEKLNQADGIHPNAAGHKIVAENVYNVLKTIL